MVKVAVVILNWNGRSLLERFVPLLEERTSGEVELVVADNGSGDGSLEWLARHHPRVQRLALGRNYGFAGGYNRALKQVEAEYFILLNSDVEVGEGWLEPLLEFMETRPEVAACMPKILDFKHRGRFEYAGASGGFLDRYGYPFCRGRIFDVLEEDRGQYDTPVPVFWASGACLMVRARDWYHAGGLDEAFFAHMEEIDLCWRLQLRGKEIWVVPDSRVWHLGGATLSEASPHKTYLNFRNNLFLLYKNLPSRRLIRVLAARLLLDGLAALKFLLSGEWRHHLAVWKAHFAFWRALGELREKRKNVPHDRPVQLHGLYPRLLPARFFLYGEKTFSSLRDSSLLQPSGQPLHGPAIQQNGNSH